WRGASPPERRVTPSAAPHGTAVRRGQRQATLLPRTRRISRAVRRRFRRRKGGGLLNLAVHKRLKIFVKGVLAQFPGDLNALSWQHVVEEQLPARPLLVLEQGVLVFEHQERPFKEGKQHGVSDQLLLLLPVLRRGVGFTGHVENVEVGV